jgi:hypothetical protein
VLAAGSRSGIDRGGGEVGAVGEVELAIDVGQVGLDGAPGDVEPLGDLGVAHPVGDEVDDLEFPPAERFPAAGRRGLAGPLGSHAGLAEKRFDSCEPAGGLGLQMDGCGFLEQLGGFVRSSGVE